MYSDWPDTCLTEAHWELYMYRAHVRQIEGVLYFLVFLYNLIKVRRALCYLIHTPMYV